MNHLDGTNGDAPEVGSPGPQPHLLYFFPGPVPPPIEPGHSPFWFLSQAMTGDLVASSWRTREEHRRAREATRAALGRFEFHAVLSYRLPALVRTLWDLAAFVAIGTWRALRHRRYDAVVAYGAVKTGYAAWIVARLTRSRLIVELPGHPFRAFQYSGGRLAALKATVAKALTSHLIRRADHVHLLYPSQLDDLPPPPVDRPQSVFPDFVRASQVPASRAVDPPYVLFLGYPWHLKGVDVLIKAWHLVTSDFPDIRLRIVGHCPDRTPFERLAIGCDTIDFEKATSNALEFIAGATLFVLPSRTEAAPRVVLESMLAGKAVVASHVDGIPTYVRDGETGLLFPSEDHRALADCLRTLLSDPALRERMGAQAAEIARREYTEAAWVGNFTAMVERTLAPGTEAGGR